MKRSILVMAILLMAGCSAIDLVDCEVEPVDQDWNPTIQPFYFPDRVDEFGKSLLERSSDIRLVDAGGLWAEVFSGRDPDADVRAEELCRGDLVEQISALGIHYLIVLDMTPETKRRETANPFIYVKWREGSTHGAVMLDVRGTNCDADRYVAQAEGDSTAFFLPPIISEPRTHLHALRTLTDRLATDILERSPERPINVVILAARP